MNTIYLCALRIIRKRISFYVLILSTLLIALSASIKNIGGGRSVMLSFKEEQAEFDKLIKENKGINSPLDAFYITHNPDLLDIQKQINELSSGKDLFLVYIERNVDNGIFNISSCIYEGNSWYQIEWTEIDGPVITKEFDRRFIDEKLIKRALDNKVYLDVDNYRRVLDETGHYLVIFNGEEVHRFAYYGSLIPFEGTFPQIIALLERFLR